MKLLPQTDSYLLRFVIVAVAAACIWFSYQAVMSGEAVAIVLIAALWIPLAVGLWLLMPWARYLALVVLLLTFLGSPLAEFSAWVIVDGTPDPLPPWKQFAYEFAPSFMAAAFFAEVLFDYKVAFRGTSPGGVPAMPRSWLLWCLSIVAIPTIIVESLTLLWKVVPIAWVALGLLMYWRTSPAGERLRIKAARALIYGVAMLYFYSYGASYIETFQMEQSVHL